MSQSGRSARSSRSLPGFRDAKTAIRPNGRREPRPAGTGARQHRAPRQTLGGRLDAELAALVPRLLELNSLHLGAPRLQHREHGSKRLVGPQVDLEAPGRAPARDDVALSPAQRAEAEEDDARAEEGGGVIAGADGHADRGRDPEAGGGRQSPDREALAQDRARPEEADAGHDLRRDAGGIGADDVRVADKELVEAVGRDEREEGRADADERVRPEACRPFPPLALKADQACQGCRDDEPKGDLADGDGHAAAFAWISKMLSIPPAARSISRSSSSRV